MIQTLKKKRLLQVETLEDRRCLAVSVGWDGPGQGSADLTYYIANSPAGLSSEEVQTALETAFDAWTEVADITFTPTSQPGLADSIDIRFSSIDGAGGILARAYFPDDVNPQQIAGDIVFDAAETWEIGNSLGSAAFDLVWVAVHEIGHSLGLEHSDAPGSVLAASVSSNQSFSSLAPADVDAILALYAPVETPLAGPNDGETPPLDDDPPLDDETPTNDTPNDTPTNDTPTNDTPWSFFRRFRFGWRFRFGGFGRLQTPDTNDAAAAEPSQPADAAPADMNSLWPLNFSFPQRSRWG